jgi:hypothetical protein
MPDLTMLAKMLDAMEERAGRMMSEYESKDYNVWRYGFEMRERAVAMKRILGECL